MLRILDFLSCFYWLLLPQLLVENLWRVRWRESYRERGPAGVAASAARGAIGLHAVPFFIPLGGAWSGRDIQRLLAWHGIDAWGMDFAFGEMHFNVRREDAGRAQSVLLDNGVELLG